MLNLKKITTTVSLLSLGALSVALLGTGCDSGTSSGAGGAGGKSSAGGAGGKSAAGGAGGTTGAGGSAGGHGGTQAAGGHGGSATGGAAAGGAAGSAAGGAAAGGAAGSAAGGAGGISALGGKGGSAAGGAGGHSAGGAGGQATTIVYNVTLTGAMEVLPQGTAVSTATGSAMVTLDTIAMTATVAGSFTGLSSAASAAHIHGPAAAGAVANPIVVLTASPATAGAISGSGTLTAQQVLDMKNGLTYVNVHSANYASGEIRGQIQ